MFPCPGYCEHYHYEHRCACIFLNYSTVWIYAQEWDNQPIFKRPPWLQRTEAHLVCHCWHQWLLLAWIHNCIFKVCWSVPQAAQNQWPKAEHLIVSAQTSSSFCVSYVNKWHWRLLRGISQKSEASFDPSCFSHPAPDQPHVLLILTTK